MKKINKEDMKIGDFVYLKDKISPRRKFMIKIVEINKLVGMERTDIINWWYLKDNQKGKLTYLFEIGNNKGSYDEMSVVDWNEFDLFKLNKKEISEFKKHLILKNL